MASDTTPIPWSEMPAFIGEFDSKEQIENTHTRLRAKPINDLGEVAEIVATLLNINRDLLAKLEAIEMRGIEIYTDERVREFDESEAELAAEFDTDVDRSG